MCECSCKSKKIPQKYRKNAQKVRGYGYSKGALAHQQERVFHAYGHGWACQCIYHPRKCKGFGLSDGEGCERLWHSISKLIAYLRFMALF
ncbi:hypothetical protein BDP27DRAFT_1232258 [Rhodocollybia butyracea]|uniref:Uncharacterized protein n=1 Tax=Rhodocollybia butyracea TaxID=206335 RepID=A0A9P5U1Z2_9AGAR|nr:hypothetical protein BDP27DRAFT_1232258 [Rhodocollybia butyracea]